MKTSGKQERKTELKRDTIAASYARKDLSRKLIKLTVAIVVMAAAAFASTYYIRAEVRNVSAARGERQRLIKNLNIIASLSAMSGSAEDIIMKIEDKLPLAIEVTTKIITRFRDDGRSFGVNAGLEIGNEISASGVLGRVEFTARADGPIEKLVDFLSHIERNNFVTVTSWEIGPGGSASEHQLRFNGVIYVREAL